MKTSTILSLLILGLLCSGCTLQQHAVSMGASGIVLDSQTHLPVKRASAFVPDHSGKSRPIITGEDGQFSIPPVLRRDMVIIMADFGPPRSTLIVECAGYTPASIELAMLHTNFVEVLLSPITK
ncbi:MAG: hypothetical protein QM813_14175 [Verrucomicrobiota bacterium]